MMFSNKVLTVIRDKLVEIREGDRLKEHGICLNLFLKVRDVKGIDHAGYQTSEFTAHAIKEYFGKYSMYPIEGDSIMYNRNDDKFHEDTAYGTARLELLDFMIEKCNKELAS